MTRFLLASDSVHATAAGCDYLVDRTDGDDAVVALTVLEGVDPERERDAADALNVATVRLPGTTETARPEGKPAPAILEAARERDVDEIVLVAAGSGGPGSTVRAVLADADRPVVVVQPA
jgi:nucleotide-binding universal stress UspA family protein